MNDVTIISLLLANILFVIGGFFGVFILLPMILREIRGRCPNCKNHFEMACNAQQESINSPTSKLMGRLGKS